MVRYKVSYIEDFINDRKRFIIGIGRDLSVFFVVCYFIEYRWLDYKIII